MKRWIAFLLCASLFASFSAVYASEETMIISSKPAETNKNTPTTDEMQEMIKKVKPLLDVPQEASEFDWNYVAGSMGNPSRWTFTWSNEDSSLRVSASCDNDGNIIYYNFRDNTNQSSYSRFPKYKKADLEKQAKDFLKRVSPVTEKSLVLVPTMPSGIYSGTYTYRFVRYENGIIFPENYVTVSVNNQTGVVTSYNSNFNMGINIPEKKNIISEETAKEILGTKLKMNLSYRVKTDYEKENAPVKAYLVYTPESGYLSVDAETGEIYTRNFSWDERNAASEEIFSSANGALKQEGVMNDAAAPEYELNEKELEQLALLSGLITKNEAINKVVSNKYLYIDGDLTAVDADLTKGGGYDYVTGRKTNSEKYYWNIRFYNPVPSDKGYDYSYAAATVDAQDGSLVSFNSSLKDRYYYENNKLEYPEIKYSAELCRETAEEFLKGQIPDKFEFTRFSYSNPTNIVEYKTDGDLTIPVYGAYNFNYVRVNEGVDFTYNNINVGIDGVSGKIYNYNFRWFDKVEFESPLQAISEKEAFDIYVGTDGFGLNYELFSEYIYNKYLEENKYEDEYLDYDMLYDTSYSARLIYSAYNIKCNTVGAVSGMLLDYNGDLFEEQKPYEYNDISGHWAEQTIKIFADVGVGFASDEFLPDEIITRDDFLSLAENAGLYIGRDQYDNTKEKGEDFNRISAIKYIIDGMGYEKIASIPDIYNVNYADADEIRSEDMGYAALAKGLKIATGNNKNLLRPNDGLTRAEALTLLKNSLNALS